MRKIVWDVRLLTCYLSFIPDVIEDNVEQAAEDVEQGVKQLAKAQEYQVHCHCLTPYLLRF